ncbi:hypothetical protein COU95_02595 [Candidatus Shapirobacteria bacterium CG10_big_fil_rev_8_21_14_0_10_40_9]|uniref:Uncharacterized protein n=1 Tax=Candidatus Shapirobacteria bacterium CG10_big_fil_rev_8_21_14_0_10_40_9 TaxID=1974888 RepID=A0A2M8L3C4_9BACT|nr:MAG: hypothetical protein COU95_02595 [Candidatus Shapirobacteria bacterium CG10_big_fil_rev_8_21_14_0_10_40_9]
MSKRFLGNFLKRRINKFVASAIRVKLPNLGNGKTILGLWGSEQIKKLGNLGQELVIMKMG